MGYINRGRCYAMHMLKEMLEWLRTARLNCLGCGAELSGGEAKMYPHSQGIDGWWVYVECGKCGRQNAVTHLMQLNGPTEGELDFEPLTELWSTYLLSDGTRLKARPILLRVYRVQEGEDGHSLKFVFDRVFTVTAPKSLLGPPNEKPHTEESLKSFRRKHVGVVKRVEPWNSYLLQTGFVKTKLRLTRVSRIVGAYDMVGNPCYEVATELIVEPSLQT